MSDHQIIDTSATEEYQASIEEGEAAAKAAELSRAPTLEGAVDYIDRKFHTANTEGKFDLAASSKKQADAYRSLQSEFTKRNQQPDDLTPQDPLSVDPLAQAAAQNVQNATDDSDLGQALAAATAAYESDGMTEEHFKSLVDLGIGREYIDQYIDNFEAGEERVLAELHGIGGGSAESYHNLLVWAGDNLTESEIATFDNAIDSGDLNQAKLMTTALQARFESMNGRSGVDLGNGGGHSYTGGYGDQSEQIAAMQDPRYASSPAYRAEVAAKTAASTF